MRITGQITRLIPPENGFPARIFVMPDPHIDMRNVDGKYFAGSGEMIVAAPIGDRKIGESVTLELVGDSLTVRTTS